MSEYRIKNFSNSFLYNTKINRAAKDNPGQIANKEIKDFIITSHRIDKNNTQAFRGFVEDVKRQQGTAVLSSVLLDPRVVLCIGQAPLPRAFSVFDAKDSKNGNKHMVFVDLTGRVEFKDGYYIIRKGVVDQVCALLFTALIYLLYRNAQNKLTNSSNLTYAATESYTAMFAYIVDYLRILGYAQNKSKICYCIAMFFLCNLMNYDVEDAYAKQVAAKVAGLNQREINAYDLYLQDIDFTDINTFVNTLSAQFNMRGFDLPTFIGKWMYLYGTGTEYATELYTSFLSLLCTAYTGSYLVQWSRIEKCVGSPNLAKVATSVLRAGDDTLNSKIFMDQADVDKFAVHSKSSAELAEAMRLKNSLDSNNLYVKEGEYKSIDSAKESAKNIIKTCEAAMAADKVNVYAEKSIGSGIATAYNSCIDLLEGKASVDDVSYALGSLTEVAKVFKNTIDNSQRYRIESTINRDIDHISQALREAGAPKEVNEVVAKTIMELRDARQYI